MAERLINPAGQGAIANPQELKRTGNERARIHARVIEANAKSTGVRPETAILRYGSATVYKASRT